MTIGKRIALLILLSALGLVALGSFGLLQLSRVNQDVAEINQRAIPGIVLLASARQAFLQARSLALSTALENDPDQQQTLGVQFRGRLDDMAGAVGNYIALDTDPRGQEQASQILTLIERYKVAANDFFQAAIRGDSAGAARVSRQAAPIVADLTNELTALVALVQQNTDLATARVEASYQRAVKMVVGALLILVALVVLIGVFIHRHIASTLAHMVKAFEQVSSRLDFTHRLQLKGKDELARVADAFDELLARLQQSFQQIRARAETVNSGAQRASTTAQEMAIASEHQSAASSSMAAAVEEMTVSINHVADRAEDTRQLASDSTAHAQHGQEVIGNTVTAINSIAQTVEHTSAQLNELEEHSEKTSHVVQVIKEITDQTNLLALNAAIEAARAGEQGRGFAVVADEVRKLAERTTQSTQEIATTIEQMIASSKAAVERMASVESAVTSGVTHSGEASQSMTEISAGSSRTIDMVAEITDAIREQGVASTDIAQQVEKIAQMTEENSAAAQSAADISQEMANTARELHGIVNKYTI